MTLGVSSVMFKPRGDFSCWRTPASFGAIVGYQATENERYSPRLRGTEVVRSQLRKRVHPIIWRALLLTDLIILFGCRRLFVCAQHSHSAYAVAPHQQ